MKEMYIMIMNYFLQYYSCFLSDIDNFETTLVCQKANEIDSDFSIYGCMNDLHGLASIGIRQAIGVCSMEWLKLYYSFLSESKLYGSPNVSKYLTWSKFVWYM